MSMSMNMSTRLGRIASAAVFFALVASTVAFGQDPVGDQMEQAKRHYRNGNYQAALSELTVIGDEAPDRADVFYLIGYCHLMMRDYSASVEAFARAFELDPTLDPRTIYHPVPPETE